MSRPSRAPERDAPDANKAGDISLSSGSLAVLYEGLLTGIVRLQATRQRIPDGESFRKRTKGTLQDIERVALPADFAAQDIRDTHFAVVALLDSVILHSNDPVRAEWERKLLQEELFGQTDAGVAFFDKLDHFHSRRDSQQLAEILEVYLLCLLLGFQGRYSGASRGELDSIIERTRKRIENIRGRSRRLSPAGVLPVDSTSLTVESEQRSDRFRLITLAVVIFTILCFLALKTHLLWTSSQVSSRLP